MKSNPKNKKPKSPADLKRKRMARSEARVKHYLDTLDATMDEYEQENPHWQAQALFWLLESGLLNLRRWIESPTSEASWENSIVEYHYPVSWDWRASKGSDRMQVNYAQLRSTDTKTEAVKVIYRIIVETVIQTTLQEWTNQMAWEKRGKGYRRLMPADVVDAIQKFRGKRKQDEIVEALYRPFSMGATDFAFDDEQIKKGGALTKKLRRELRDASRRMVPSPKLELDINGHPMKLNLIFQARPLVVDVLRKNAYYPITVGFVLMPKAGRNQDVLTLMKEPWTRPATWDPSDREDLWRMLTAVIRKWSSELKPAKPAPVKEAVLTVSAKLKVPVDASDPAGANFALDEIVKQLRRTGQLVEMQHSWSGSSAPMHDFTAMLFAVKNAKKTSDKGNALELLVGALFGTVPGFTVQPNQRTDTEEIDLVVINGSEEPRWRQGSPIILVECKNWSSVCGKNEIVQFRDKLANRYGQCGLGFLISWCGFAGTVIKDTLRNSRGNSLIILLDGKALEEACKTGRFLPVLCNAWDAAVLT